MENTIANFISAHEGALEDEVVAVVLQEQHLDPTLALHYSSNLLEDEVTIHVGESHHKVVLSPIKMASPVRIYEELGPDKGKAHVITSSKNETAAAKKSVQILSKFWGDVVESDHTTDDTMDPDTDSEKMNMHPVALKFLEAQVDALHKP